MPPVSAAWSFDTPQPGDRPGADDVPPSDRGRHRESGPVPPAQRFRVVTRKPLARRLQRATRDSFHRSLIFASFPVLCLLVYVMFWTLAMRGGYFRDQLRQQIRSVRIEQAELKDQKLRLQSPEVVQRRAERELGMQPAARREFARLAAPAAPRR